MGIEPATSSLPRKCSTTELQRQRLPEICSYFNKELFTCQRAGDEVRTRDLQLGRLSLYQLSYSRKIKTRTQRKLFKTIFRMSRAFFKSRLSLWGEQVSNLRRPKPTDLQSVLVDRLSISPLATVPIFFRIVSQRRDSNPRPADYKSAALPAELLRPGIPLHALFSND